MKKTPIIILTAMLLLNTSTIFAQNIEQISKEENKFIYSNSIKLFLGDSIYVEPANIDRKLTDFTLKEGIVDSTKTFSIIFVYDKFGSNNASLLKVSNPFSKQLVYKAKIRTKPGSRYSETSIMPVYPKIFGIEMWPYKIESIILYDFELK
jgi:hypothetical protein